MGVFMQLKDLGVPRSLEVFTNPQERLGGSRTL